MCEGIELKLFFSFSLGYVAFGEMCVRGGAVCILIFYIYILVLYVMRRISEPSLVGSFVENKGFSLISRMTRMATEKHLSSQPASC